MLNFDKLRTDAIEKGIEPVCRYLYAHRAKNNTWDNIRSIVYVTVPKNGKLFFYGAYYGYCGGGVYDGGFFTIGNNKHLLLDYDDVEKLQITQPNVHKLYETLMHKVWQVIEERGVDQISINDMGSYLLLSDEENKGNEMVFCDNNFYSDELSEISNKWKIGIQF